MLKVRIVFAPEAARTFRKLPLERQRSITDRLRILQTNGLPPALVPQSGRAHHDTTLQTALAAESEQLIAEAQEAHVHPSLSHSRTRLECDDADDTLHAGKLTLTSQHATAWLAIPAGDALIVCVPSRDERTLTVATIEDVHMPLHHLAWALVSKPITRAFRRNAGDHDELYAATWPRTAGPWTLRFRTRGRRIMDMRIELRRAWRSLLRQPAMTILAVATLGLGIGLPTAMFGLLNALILKGLPVENPRAVLHLERRPVNRSGEGWGTPIRDYRIWQDQQRSFTDLAAYTFDNVSLRSDARTDRYDAARIAVNTFDLVGVRPVIGRTFGPEDDRAGASPVIIGHTIWRDHFASDPAALGATVYVDGAAHTVVGVMPEKFRFPLDQDLWVPLDLSASAELADDVRLEVVGRLRDGVDLGAARAEFALIAARITEQFPDPNVVWGASVKPYTVRYLGETPTRTMYVFVAAVMFVLLIACTNVANLLLVRAVHRIRDLAIRVAIGAGRWKTVASLFFESSILAILGGLTGLAVAITLNAIFQQVLAQRLPYWVDFSIDPTIVAFVAAVSLLAAMLAGMLPAIKALQPDLVATLRDESRGSTGLRLGRVMRGMIVVQVALSLALLVSTGLLLRGNARVRDVAIGFPVDELFTARLTLPDSYEPAARARFQQQLEQNLAAEPDIRMVTLATETPIMRSAGTRVSLQNTTATADDQLPYARRAIVSTDFFATFDAELIQGRAFETTDRDGAEPVVIVNESFVHRNLAGTDPIGQRIRLGGLESTEPWRTIIGVAPDLWMAALDASGDRNPPGVYLPLAQVPPTSFVMALRTRGEPMRLTSRVRDIVFQMDADLPLHEIRSMRQVVADNSWFFAMGAAIMGVCGIGALLLAIIGLYGVVAFSVGKRTREFGIRMAMGADYANIVKLVLRRGSVELAVGIAVGLALATAVARGIGSLMFETSTTDPVVFLGVSAFLLAVALTATFIPARRAARADPLHALRADG